MGIFKTLKWTLKKGVKFVGNKFLIKLALKIAKRLAEITPNKIDDKAVSLLNKISKHFTEDAKNVLCYHLTENDKDIPHIIVSLDKEGKFVVENKPEYS